MSFYLVVCTYKIYRQHRHIRLCTVGLYPVRFVVWVSKYWNLCYRHCVRVSTSGIKVSSTWHVLTGTVKRSACLVLSNRYTRPPDDSCVCVLTARTKIVTEIHRRKCTDTRVSFDTGVVRPRRPPKRLLNYCSYSVMIHRHLLPGSFSKIQ